MYVGHLAVAQLIVDVQLGGRVTVDEVLLAVHLAQIAHRADRAAATLQGLAEGRAKLAVEVGVDERVEGAVEIAHPKHHRHHHVAALAGVAQGRDDVPAIKRERDGEINEMINEPTDRSRLRVISEAVFVD